MFEAASHQRNRNAEEAYVRKHVWGSDEAMSQDDDMGDIFLGDVTQVSSNSGANGLLKTLAIGALGAMIPAAGVGGYVLSQMLADKDDGASITPADDATLDLGLGRIDDLTMPGK